MDVSESVWLEEHVSKGLLVQLGRADSTCFWCRLCTPLPLFFFKPCNQSLFPEVTQAYSSPCNLYPTMDQPEPRSRGVVHRRVENSRAQVKLVSEMILEPSFLLMSKKKVILNSISTLCNYILFVITTNVCFMHVF